MNAPEYITYTIRKDEGWIAYAVCTTPEGWKFREQSEPCADVLEATEEALAFLFERIEEKVAGEHGYDAYDHEEMSRVEAGVEPTIPMDDRLSRADMTWLVGIGIRCT